MNFFAAGADRADGNRKEISIRELPGGALTPPQVERLRKKVNCFAPQAVSPENFALSPLTKSALTMSHLAYMPCAPAGLLSRDAIVEQAAQARGIPALALVSQADIAARRAQMPEQVHVDTLYRGAGDIDHMYLPLAHALNNGSFRAIAAPAGESIVNRARRTVSSGDGCGKKCRIGYRVS